MKNKNTNLTVSRDYLGNVEIKRGIYEGDTLSPLLYFITLMPHSLVLGDVKAGYHLGRKNGPVSHEKSRNTAVNTVQSLVKTLEWNLNKY